MGQSWMIASGKGGVGKSTITACLAIGLAMTGERVVIIDTDIGLRNMDAVLGLENNVVYDICDVVDKECKLFDALLKHPDYPNLSLLSAAQFRRVKAIDNTDVSKIVKKLKMHFSYVIIDCPAGLGRGLQNSFFAADETILIVTPDDMAIRDVEQTANLLMKKHQPRPHLIVNRLDPKLIKAGEMYSADVVAAILDLSLIGAIPNDPALYRALLTHRAPMEPGTISFKAIQRTVNRMLGNMTPIPPMGVAKKSLLHKLFSKKEMENRNVKREQTFQRTY